MIQRMKAWLLAGLFCLGTAAQAHAYAVSGTPPQTCNDLVSPDWDQAFLWVGPGYSDPCYVVQLDGWSSWSSWDASTGLPNDQIKGIWVGSGVNLVLFKNSFNTKDNSEPLHFGPGTLQSSLGSGWDNQVSAVRLQTFPYGQCSNGLILYADANYQGDCTELATVEKGYPNPVQMGFRNDTLSSLKNTDPVHGSTLYNDASCSGGGFRVNGGQSLPSMPSGYNDVISSASADGGFCY